jgi:hypothetical protein
MVFTIELQWHGRNHDVLAIQQKDASLKSRSVRRPRVMKIRSAEMGARE